MNNTSTSFLVDAAHCQRAEDELYALLRQQQYNNIDQAYDRVREPRLVFRVLAIAALIIGFAMSSIVLAVYIFLPEATPDDPNKWIGILASTLFVVFITPFAILASLFPSRIRQWEKRSLKRRADKRARRYAQRAIRVARRLAPYEANYQLQGDLLIYTRGKNGERQKGWNRKLSKFRDRGIAVQGTSVTAIFRRHSSLFPSVVILQDTPDWLGLALRGIGMTPIPVASA